MKHRFAPARLVVQARPVVDEPTTPPLGDEDDEVGERLSEPECDHVGARLEHRQVEFGRVAGREMHPSVSGGEAGRRGTVGVGFGIEVAEGEDDRIDDQFLDDQFLDIWPGRLDRDRLASIGPIGQIDGAPGVDDDLDVGRQQRRHRRWNQSR